MVDEYADMLNKKLIKGQKLVIMDIDMEDNEIVETFEKLQTACDILDSKPCTTSEGVVFFLENFDSLSNSLTKETLGHYVEEKGPPRFICFPKFVPGDFSFLTFGSLKDAKGRQFEC
ncbi:Hypothetical predicted protein [Mytilus galloprovincialis]|uniref:Uncharacterized protein n=1 Tax=Mytilus galloprovincialis TaxID=29158 RepID=A0A8B6CLQ1_MYTGA|nr:Hypothetical predicted protein [Mytilus galloprovincialis]